MTAGQQRPNAAQRCAGEFPPAWNVLRAACALLTHLLHYVTPSSVLPGGAKYIPTGRGYAIKHNSFVKVYTSYARSHLYYAAELLLLAILLMLVDMTVRGQRGSTWWDAELGPLLLPTLAPTLVPLLFARPPTPARNRAPPQQPMWLAPCVQSYAGIAWSTWMVSVAILWAPFWFNPQTFQLVGGWAWWVARRKAGEWSPPAACTRRRPPVRGGGGGGGGMPVACMDLGRVAVFFCTGSIAQLPFASR